MKRLLTLTLLGLILSVASYAMPIAGTLGCCVGSTSYLFDSTSGTWSWSSSNTGVATVDTASGMVTGVSAGTATISYTTISGVETAVFTVFATPAAIAGPTSVCPGSSIALTDATPGGAWSCFGPASIISSSGVLTGTSPGSATVHYTTGLGCYASAVITIGSSSIGFISGDSVVCSGSTTTLSCSPAGGVWSSSNTAIATVNAATGVVGGVSGGVVSISYAVTGVCGSVSTYTDVEVMSSGTAGTISGLSSVGAGASAYYSSTVWGGTWSSSNTAVATVNPSTGWVYGVAPGTATITYTVTSCGVTSTATEVITVTALNRISGTINFSGGLLDTSTVIKVWLITFDPITNLLEAADSLITYSGGTSAYYQFMGEPTDSYRVKAAAFPPTFSSTGYTPTYHTSSAYWASANVFHHSGGADDGEDINMGYGTVTAGPGFIAGDVTTGANRGTTDGDPVVGMLIYIISSTGAIQQQTYTDGAGHYSFNNLPVGTYTIYPEAINYHTTAYTSINLASGSSSMSTASFVQHLLSKTITPVTEGVNSVRSYVSSVIAFPNPTSGKLNVQWQESVSEVGTVTIADITGKEIYKTTMNMNEGTGTNMLDLSSLTNGIYIMSIKSGTINYNTKIQLQH